MWPGTAAAAAGIAAAVVAAPAAGVRAAGVAACAAVNTVVWGGVGYNAGRVVGTVGATDSDRGGGNMLKENAEATAALGAASRGEVEGGQYAGIG